MIHSSFPAYYYLRILGVLVRDVEDEQERQDIFRRFSEAMSQEIVVKDEDAQ